MGKDLKMRHGKVLMFFAIILSLLICAPPATDNVVHASTYDAHVSAQNQTIHRGQTFEVDVNISENTGILTLFLTIKFDHSIFSLTNVEQDKTALGNLNMEHSGSGYDYIDKDTGGFNLIWDGSKPNSTNGTIVKLTFQSKLTAPIGTYPIEIAVDQENTTSAYGVEAPIQVTSPEITVIEGEFIVVWQDWNGQPIENTNLTGHPYNEQTGGYEFDSTDSLDADNDYPNNPVRPEDSKYSYEFYGWEGAIWKGEAPEGTSVILYIARYISTPVKHIVNYYVDGKGAGNVPDGIIDVKEEKYTADEVAYGSPIDDKLVPDKGESNYTFVGWYTDPECKNKLVDPLMPDHDIDLYGKFKFNLRETGIPVIQLKYIETITENNEKFAIVEVEVLQNPGYGLSSLMLTLTEYNRDYFTLVGGDDEPGLGEIFDKTSFWRTPYENASGPLNINYSWNNSSSNTTATGLLMTLKFKVSDSAPWGAYDVVMVGDINNTTYKEGNEEWYSKVEIINTKIPIGNNNHWEVSVEGMASVVEVTSAEYVPFDIELVVNNLTLRADTIIDNDVLEEMVNDNKTIQALFEIYYKRNETRLTQEEVSFNFKDQKVEVKIKLTPIQASSKNLNIYYIDDQGKLILYESTIKDGYLIFETNHFSNWALIGDSVVAGVETSSIRLLRVSLLFFGISASALLSIAFVRNRKKQSLVVYKNSDEGGKGN